MTHSANQYRKLIEPTSTFGAVDFGDNAYIDENAMAITFPFADGHRRDGVGDLLEIGGILTERHQKNPVVLFDHGKNYVLPVALTEDPKTKEYTVHLDELAKVAKAKAFFYQGKGDFDKSGEHALFSEQLFDLMAKRFVRAGSIGYQVVKSYPIQADYIKGIPQGQHLIATTLLEVSAVVVPANQDTVAKALSLPKVCGKPMSPWLVKSLMPYAPTRKVQLGWEGKNVEIHRHVVPNGNANNPRDRGYRLETEYGPMYDYGDHDHVTARAEDIARHATRDTGRVHSVIDHTATKAEAEWETKAKIRVTPYDPEALNRKIDTHDNYRVSTDYDKDELGRGTGAHTQAMNYQSAREAHQDAEHHEQNLRSRNYRVERADKDDHRRGEIRRQYNIPDDAHPGMARDYLIDNEHDQAEVNRLYPLGKMLSLAKSIRLKYRVKAQNYPNNRNIESSERQPTRQDKIHRVATGLANDAVNAGRNWQVVEDYEQQATDIVDGQYGNTGEKNVEITQSPYPDLTGERTVRIRDRGKDGQGSDAIHLAEYQATPRNIRNAVEYLDDMAGRQNSKPIDKREKSADTPTNHDTDDRQQALDRLGRYDSGKLNAADEQEISDWMEHTGLPRERVMERRYQYSHDVAHGKGIISGDRRLIRGMDPKEDRNYRYHVQSERDSGELSHNVHANRNDAYIHMDRLEVEHDDANENVHVYNRIPKATLGHLEPNQGGYDAEGKSYQRYENEHNNIPNGRYASKWKPGVGAVKNLRLKYRQQKAAHIQQERRFNGADKKEPGNAIYVVHQDTSKGKRNYGYTANEQDARDVQEQWNKQEQREEDTGTVKGKALVRISQQPNGMFRVSTYWNPDSSALGAPESSHSDFFEVQHARDTAEDIAKVIQSEYSSVDDSTKAKSIRMKVRHRKAMIRIQPNQQGVGYTTTYHGNPTNDIADHATYHHDTAEEARDHVSHMWRGGNQDYLHDHVKLRNNVNLRDDAPFFAAADALEEAGDEDGADRVRSEKGIKSDVRIRRTGGNPASPVRRDRERFTVSSEGNRIPHHNREYENIPEQGMARAIAEGMIDTDTNIRGEVRSSVVEDHTRGIKASIRLGHSQNMIPHHFYSPSQHRDPNDLQNYYRTVEYIRNPGEGDEHGFNHNSRFVDHDAALREAQDMRRRYENWGLKVDFSDDSEGDNDPPFDPTKGMKGVVRVRKIPSTAEQPQRFSISTHTNSGERYDNWTDEHTNERGALDHAQREANLWNDNDEAAYRAGEGNLNHPARYRVDYNPNDSGASAKRGDRAGEQPYLTTNEEGDQRYTQKGMKGVVRVRKIPQTADQPQRYSVTTHTHTGDVQHLGSDFTDEKETLDFARFQAEAWNTNNYHRRNNPSVNYRVDYNPNDSGKGLKGLAPGDVRQKLKTRNVQPTTPADPSLATKNVRMKLRQGKGSARIYREGNPASAEHRDREHMVVEVNSNAGNRPPTRVVFAGPESGGSTSHQLGRMLQNRTLPDLFPDEEHTVSNEAP